MSHNGNTKMPPLTALAAVGDTIKAPSRECNQDSFLIDDSFRFVIVADGMGGRRGGEIASRIAIESLSKHLSETYDSEISNSCMLEEGFKKAHEAVLAFKKTDCSLDAMGTTLLALLVRPMYQPEHYTLANIGDSRLYLADEQDISLETVDDTLVQKAVNDGRLTLSQADHHPYRHVLTQCIGQNDKNPIPAIKNLKINEGDIILLCTDGLHQCRDQASIHDVIKKCRYSESVQYSIATVVARELLSIRPTDDATVIVIEIPKTQPTLRENFSLY